MPSPPSTAASCANGPCACDAAGLRNEPSGLSLPRAVHTAVHAAGPTSTATGEPQNLRMTSSVAVRLASAC